MSGALGIESPSSSAVLSGTPSSIAIPFRPGEGISKPVADKIEHEIMSEALLGKSNVGLYPILRLMKFDSPSQDEVYWINLKKSALAFGDGQAYREWTLGTENRKGYGNTCREICVL
jgi:hypothetical protein